MQAPKRQRRIQDLVIDHLIALTNPEIKRFLGANKVSAGSISAKDEFRAAIKGALNDGRITTATVVAYLDEVTPWGKQHVYLYGAPPAKDWRVKKWVVEHLKAHKLDGLLDAKSDRLMLPDELTLASIGWTAKSVRVTAIRSREGWVRNEEFDKRGKTPDKRPIWLKSYVHQVLRAITAFEWNFVTNESFLQVTQLPTGQSYEAAAAEFAELIKEWLNLDDFKIVDIRPAIKALHEMEEQRKSKAVSHALDYGRTGGRHISVRSTSTKVPLLGDRVTDGLLKTIRNQGIPRIGDFYVKDGELRTGQHFILVADHNRINLATPSNENEVRNVLNLLRTLSK